MADPTPKKAAVRRTTGVSRKEFDAFQKETREGIGAILEALDGLTHREPSTVTSAAPEIDIVVPSEEVRRLPVQSDTPSDLEEELEDELDEEMEGGPNGFLPPQYEAIFHRYFDPEDGFTARITFPEVDEDGREAGGITFTIFVPEKFSNVTPAHRALYKQDLRTRAVMPHNIAKGIEDWCKLVAQNLKYDKKIATK